MKGKLLSTVVCIVVFLSLLQIRAFSQEAAPEEQQQEPAPAKLQEATAEQKQSEAAPATVQEAAPEEERPGAAPVTPQEAPLIVFDELEYDFGEIEQQVNVKHIFKFQNKGNALLVIDNVRPSCGCTGTLLSSKEIPPGGNGEIEVTFKPGLQSGEKKKAIYVYSNDPLNPTLKLYITADIVVPVEVRPRQLNWMADRDVPSKRMVELLYQPELNIKIVSLETSSPAFTATATPKSGGDKPGYDIEVTFDGKLPGNRFTEKLTITTDSPKYPAFQVFMRGTVTGKVKVVPSAVALGVIQDDEIPTRSIRVYAKDRDLDFKITGIESSSPLISTEITRDENLNGYRVDVSLTSMPPAGAFSGTLLIVTDVEKEPALEVAVYAYVKPMS